MNYTALYQIGMFLLYILCTYKEMKYISYKDLLSFVNRSIIHSMSMSRHIYNAAHTHSSRYTPLLQKHLKVKI